MVLTALARYAYQYQEAPFLLTSGQQSREYLDCKQALGRAEVLPHVGALLLSYLRESVVAVGGLTMGADPLAIAASYASSSTSRSVSWFSVRKQPKEHGKNRLIEGAVQKGSRVAILDDVVTTGGSTIQAIEKTRGEGLEVVQVLVLVDRENGGMAAIRDALGPDISLDALFTKSEIQAEVARQEDE